LLQTLFIPSFKISNLLFTTFVVSKQRSIIYVVFFPQNLQAILNNGCVNLMQF